ncbi:MAG: glutathione S-transferase [Rickettsiales bacterium]
MTTLTLYHHPLSGNAHRARLFLNLLAVPHELVEVDLLAGEQKGAAFLALNPRGQVPVLVDGDHTVAASNAILAYLSARHDDGTWWPREAEAAGAIQFWLSRAAIDVANGPAAARLVTLFGAGLDHAQAKQIGHRFLAELDAALDGVQFLVAGRPTVADVAIYSYVAHAPEGGIPLTAYPNVRAWIARIEALPGFVGMQDSPLLAAA